MRKVLGFTLIELMIVVAIVALLAAVALTSYQKQVRKGKRAEARSLVADFSARQEKRRQNVATYGTCDQLLAPTTCANYNNSLVNYQIGITFPTSGTCPGGQAMGAANSYILTATPKAGSDQNNDTACTSIVLNNNCGTIEKTPAACW